MFTTHTPVAAGHDAFGHDLITTHLGDFLRELGKHFRVGKMLAKVLEVQYEGDKAASDKFIEQYTTWDENLHGVVAKNIREQQGYRFRLFTYAALNE